MDRILKHYNNKDKDFDSYVILLKPNVSDKELFELEKRAIKKHCPKYNIVHNEITPANSDYEFIKEINKTCYHTFITLSNNNVKCLKCGYEMEIGPSKTMIKKQKDHEEKKIKKEKKELKEHRRILKNIELRNNK